MYYQIITELGDIYIAERSVMNTRMTTIFKDIPEEFKYEQLELAAYLRFKQYFEIKDITATNNKNNSQWLKLVPQVDDRVNLDVPSLLLSV